MLNDHGYVVTRPFPGSNIGSNLSSLAGAVLLAGRLQRGLVVDWRGMAQLQDTTINYFAEFFENRPSLVGVPTRYAPIEGADYDAKSGTPWLNANEACAVIRGDVDVSAHEFIVLQEYHGPDRLFVGSESDRFMFLRRFYRDVQPARDLRKAIDSWADDHLDGRFVVGVNIRTGNGAYFGPGQPYAGRVDIGVLENRGRLLRVLERAIARRVARLPRHVRSASVTFYATDSAPMSDLLSRLPNSVTRRRTYPPPDVGDLHAFAEAPGSDRQSVVDTLADMFLLARCDALIYNNSMFNQYARVVTGFFSGNQVHVDSLFLKGKWRRLVSGLRRRLGRPLVNG